MSNNIDLDAMRHSCQHVLAQAMYDLYPGVKMAMGPATKEGFYGDFDLPDGVSISVDDLPKIEEQMQKIINTRVAMVRKEISIAEARELFKDNEYKQDWISEIEQRGENATVYWTGDKFVDLCKGPHVGWVSDIKAFKLLSVAGAYWHGDSNNKMLTRIYGTAFASKQELQDYLTMIEEAKKRDHRKIGKLLDLFYFDPTAPGCPYWLPKGLKMYNILLDYWRQEHEKAGYQEFAGPLMNSRVLWETSGHWDHYKDDMYLLTATEMPETEVYALKPMSCPSTMLLFNMKTRSYQDLPIRFSDVDMIHRNEASGALNGMFRVREFHQDDAHIFIAEDQIEEEYERLFALADQFYNLFGLKYQMKLSTRPDDFIGDVETWNRAEAALRRILDKKCGVNNYEIKDKDGAFYGPKVDIQMKDALGREWQTGTFQLDFQLAGRFGCKYIDKDGQEKTPVVIHRVLYGSLERFFGVITEHFAGAFPVWISPVQVRVLPVSDKHREAGAAMVEKLKAAGIRAEMERQSNTIGYQIRAAHEQKIPYSIVLGDKELESGTISVRDRQNNQKSGLSLDEFIKTVQEIDSSKSLDLWK